MGAPVGKHGGLRAERMTASTAAGEQTSTTGGGGGRNSSGGRRRSLAALGKLQRPTPLATSSSSELSWSLHKAVAFYSSLIRAEHHAPLVLSTNHTLSFVLVLILVLSISNPEVPLGPTVDESYTLSVLPDSRSADISAAMPWGAIHSARHCAHPLCPQPATLAHPDVPVY
ncbi:hypothetical protein OsI_30366 [Oryza sativa Indica Group]|uniref:Beta-hexosaminidase eukaryotic type N-terminal domain-containing protein n=1 Tax=Oryza sativa subsp. indica TaxID=39946 RepID=B8BCX1_ORYSI|nr:hypothetical protein OsI_30366 [Oryza sativa Indica Group]